MKLIQEEELPQSMEFLCREFVRSFFNERLDVSHRCQELNIVETELTKSIHFLHLQKKIKQMDYLCIIKMFNIIYISTCTSLIYSEKVE